MKRKWISIVGIVAIATLFVFGTVSAKAFRGTDIYDGKEDEIGMVDWLDNPTGFHFWFTIDKSYSHYIEGHSYHNIYKLVDVIEDPSEWCGPVTIPNKSPFDKTRHVGEQTYYKIWDMTAEMWVCP